MSYRLRIALPFAVLAAAALAACGSSGDQPRAGGSVAAPPSAAAPVSPSSAAAGEAAGPDNDEAGPDNDEVCGAVNAAVTAGSVEIADNAVKSIDERWSTKESDKRLRASFRAMAGKVETQAARAADPELKAAVDLAADRLGRGARAANPGKFLQNDFPTVTKEMDKICRG